MAKQQVSITDKVFAYFVNMKGDIIPAPDTRVTVQQVGLSPREWTRHEAIGREADRGRVPADVQAGVGAQAGHDGSAALAREAWSGADQNSLQAPHRTRAFTCGC